MYNVQSEKAVYKSTLPIYFYFLRWLAIFLFISLIVFQVDLAVIAIAIFATFLIITNRKNYIIEAYSKYFKIILPSFYGKRFNIENSYFYEEVSEFVFERGNYNLVLAILGELTKLIIPVRASGFLFAYSKPKIRFNLKGKDNSTAEQIEVIVNDSNSSFIKAIDLLPKKIKRKK